MLVKILIIAGSILLASFILALVLGRAFKKVAEDAEKNMHEPIYDKRYEKS